MNNIIKIAKIKNVCIKNLNNGYTFPSQSILKIEFQNGESRTIDLKSELDITTIEHLEIIRTKRSKEIVLFKASEFI